MIFMTRLQWIGREMILARNIEVQFFCHDEDQKSKALNLIKEFDKSGEYEKPIVTEVIILNKFLSCRRISSRLSG